MRTWRLARATRTVALAGAELPTRASDSLYACTAVRRARGLRRARRALFNW